MYNYFTGIVKEIQDNFVVLETSGIGYEFTASSFCVNALKLDQTAKIYAYLSVKEDDMSLFGFSSKEEKAMFLRLISISGIGPKNAIGILSGLALDDLCAAIAGGDAKALSGIKGIGKKMSERIVLELRDKLGEEYSFVGENSNASVNSDVGNDAVLGLMALGYTRQEAVNSVKRVNIEGKTVEQIIKAALKRG